MKRALSPVIATVILIGLSVALVAGILGIIKPFAEDQLEESQRCYDILGGIEFNYEYTCYNATNNTMVVSISQKDVEIEGILFIVTNINGTESQTFNLNNIEGDPYKVPGPEAGKRYYFYDINYKPSRIEIVPIVGGKACESMDSTHSVNSCFP